MSSPFSDSIIGSWLFTRSTHPNFTPRIIYHFTAGGKCFWELDRDGKRILAPINYAFAGETLTFIYSNGTQQDFPLTSEDDGSVHLLRPDGTLWWMVRLVAREPYSEAFVDEHGQLQKHECA